MIIADFFVQGEKESGGGRSPRFFASSCFKDELVSSELELWRGAPISLEFWHSMIVAGFLSVVSLARLSLRFRFRISFS